jgi:hypothetical protein
MSASPNRAGFQAFLAGREIQVQQLGAEHQVDLVDVRQADHAVEAEDFHPRAGFLQGFPGGALGGGLAVFHEAGRQGPQAVFRLDGAAAQAGSCLPIPGCSPPPSWGCDSGWRRRPGRRGAGGCRPGGTSMRTAVPQWEQKFMFDA